MVSPMSSSHPHVIFTTTTTRSVRPSHDEWQAFIKDSEGNTVGLIAFQRHEGAAL